MTYTTIEYAALLSAENIQLSDLVIPCDQSAAEEFLNAIKA
jgi:hypothetical protein